MAKRILIKPLITEKTTKLSEANGTYGFVVGMDANKIEIKNAVEKNYGVTVAAVKTITDNGKFGWKRSTGERLDKYKRTIDFFSTI